MKRADLRLDRRATLAGLVSAFGLGALGARAEDFAAPKGDILLTLHGKITKTNVGGSLQLDMDQMAALPQTTFQTSTTWTEGKPTFKGVLMKDMIAAAGASGKTIQMSAVNDYAISMPLADVTPQAPLLAYLMDGKPMSLRDKGPVWLVYPYDADARWRTEETYSRSIWQLTDITFGD